MRPTIYFLIGIVSLVFEHVWMTIIHYPLVIVPSILIYPLIKTSSLHKYIGPFFALACIADVFSGLHFGIVSGLYIGILAIMLVARLHIQPEKSSVYIQIVIGLVFVLLFFVMYGFIQKTILHQFTLIIIESLGTIILFEFLSIIDRHLSKPHFLS